jgi:NAD(P)-dependent dehydrogenase (short-subunit alcohol dehydrogenase family)
MPPSGYGRRGERGYSERHSSTGLDNSSEIAESIVFLASPRASYLTGATVAVDGGYAAI